MKRSIRESPSQRREDSKSVPTSARVKYQGEATEMLGNQHLERDSITSL